MNTAAQVTDLINEWKKPVHGLTKAELAAKIAEACMGWPYVWGGYGQYDTPTNRESYADRSSCPEAEAKVIRSKCQVLNGKSGSCSGCRFYPGGKTRFFDCRGFTRWVLQQVGISIQGAGATSQWNTEANWSQKGEIRDMPENCVCCVFQQNGKTMQHTGLYVGSGVIIHCSGEVKKGKPTDKGWTHYAIPKGMEGEVDPVPEKTLPTLRKGSKGEYVTKLQTLLIQQGYDLAPYGADGKFGNKTAEALTRFQNDHGLQPDAVCGPKTWDALLSGKTETYTVTIRGVSKTVAEGIIRIYGGTMTAEGE